MRKSIALIFFVFLIAVINCKSQDSATSKMAKICFLRKTGMSGAAWGLSLFIDDSMYCKINNRRYSFHYINSGEHTFFIKDVGQSIEKGKSITGVTVNLKEGETYYVIVVIIDKISKMYHSFQLMQEKEALEMIKKFKPEKNCLD